MESIDTLVVARWIAPVEPDVLLPHHALAIRAGRIVAMLPEAEARARFAPLEVVERDHHVVTPGLVDACVNTSRTLFRGLDAGLAPDARDGRLEALERSWLDPDAARDSALLAIAEMVAAGTTCFGDGGHYPDVVAAAVVDAGVRAAVGLPISERATPWAADADGHFDRSLRLHDEFREHARVSTAFTVQSVAALGNATLQRLKVLVDQVEAPLVVPLYETAGALTACRREYGCTPLARLERIDLVNASLSVVHATHFGSEDVATAARSHVRVVHTPTADLARGHGIAPIAALLEAGVEVCVATGRDPATYGFDPVRQAGLAALLAGGTTGEPAAVPARVALRMATLAGAASLGLDDEIGSLRPGKWADLACFDLARLPSTPHDDPVATLVAAGARDYVTDVWVAGKRVYGEGAAARLDPDEVALRAADRRRRMLAAPTHGARE
jgi:5-methylthioadenosine/S-adenosylhomocysteine deaminase